MKAFTPMLSPLAFTLFTTILANPVDRAPLVPRQKMCPDLNTPAAGCDQCGVYQSSNDYVTGVGIWGIFTNPSTWAGCFNSYTPISNTVACPCVFDYNTITPAIIGYAYGPAFVDVTWNDDGDATSGEIMVNVYSWWPRQMDYTSPVYPLIGSSIGPMSFTWGSSSEAYSNVITTLPDPMTFTVLASPQPGAAAEADASIKVAVAYGDQSFTLSAFRNGTIGSSGKFTVAPPPAGTWWAEPIFRSQV